MKTYTGSNGRRVEIVRAIVIRRPEYYRESLEDTVREGQYLLLRKKSTGLWEVPGGEVEGEEGSLEAIMRELEEETSINKEDIERLLVIKDEKENVKTDRGLRASQTYIVIIPYDKRITIKDLNTEEHDAFAWRSSNEAMEYLKERGRRGGKSTLYIIKQLPQLVRTPEKYEEIIMRTSRVYEQR